MIGWISGWEVRGKRFEVRGDDLIAEVRFQIAEVKTLHFSTAGYTGFHEGRSKMIGSDDWK